MGHIVHVRDSINLWPKKLSGNHHCSRWISTCWYYFTSPQLLTRMGFFFYKHIPTSQSCLTTISTYWLPSKMKNILLYETELHVNTTYQFNSFFFKATVYNEILLAHKISDKYLTMLDIDLIKSNEILVFCNRT